MLYLVLVSNCVFLICSLLCSFSFTIVLLIYLFNPTKKINSYKRWCNGVGRRRCSLHRRVRQDARRRPSGHPRSNGAADDLDRQSRHHNDTQLALLSSSRGQLDLRPLGRPQGRREHRFHADDLVAFRHDLHH